MKLNELKDKTRPILQIRSQLRKNPIFSELTTDFPFFWLQNLKIRNRI